MTVRISGKVTIKDKVIISKIAPPQPPTEWEYIPPPHLNNGGTSTFTDCELMDNNIALAVESSGYASLLNLADGISVGLAQWLGGSSGDSIYSVSSLGNTVVAGFDKAAISYNTNYGNGTWTKLPVGTVGGTTDRVNAIVSDGTRMVAVSNIASVAISSDGINWTKDLIPFSNYRDMHDAAYGDTEGQWAVVGGQRSTANRVHSYYTSDNFDNITEFHPPGGSTAESQVGGIEYLNGLWFVGFYENYYYTSDFTNWVELPIPEAVNNIKTRLEGDRKAHILGSNEAGVTFMITYNGSGTPTIELIDPFLDTPVDGLIKHLSYRDGQWVNVTSQYASVSPPL